MYTFYISKNDDILFIVHTYDEFVKFLQVSLFHKIHIICKYIESHKQVYHISHSIYYQERQKEVFVGFIYFCYIF